MVKVKEMVVGKSYKGFGKLVNKELIPGGAGGSGGQEPTFVLTFEDNREVTKAWDDDIELTGGGRRKSRRNKKSRKTRRKSTRR